MHQEEEGNYYSIELNIRGIRFIHEVLTAVQNGLVETRRQ